MTDSKTDIAFDLVNEIVNSSFESSQKPTAHSVSCVNKKTFEEWAEKFPFVKTFKENTKNGPIIKEVIPN